MQQLQQVRALCGARPPGVVGDNRVEECPDGASQGLRSGRQCTCVVVVHRNSSCGRKAITVATEDEELLLLGLVLCLLVAALWTMMRVVSSSGRFENHSRREWRNGGVHCCGIWEAIC